MKNGIVKTTLLFADLHDMDEEILLAIRWCSLALCGSASRFRTLANKANTRPVLFCIEQRYLGIGPGALRLGDVARVLFRGRASFV